MWDGAAGAPALEAVNGGAVALAKLYLQHADAAGREVHGVGGAKCSFLLCQFALMVGVSIRGLIAIFQGAAREPHPAMMRQPSGIDLGSFMTWTL